MNHIKLIKNEQDHELALARLMSLMDSDPEPNSAEADEMDVLALLIEKYEEESFPIEQPEPVEAIKFRMAQQGLKNKDLVPFIGSASKVSEVLNGKRPLSLNMVRKLSAGLGISADVLIKEPNQQVAATHDIEWSAFPLNEMRKKGYFGDFNGSANDLKEYAGEIVSQFLNQVKAGFDLQPAMLRTTAHYRANDKEVDQYALWAWQVRVLQKAAEKPLTQQYNADTVTLDWMRKLAQLSWSEQGPSLACEYLNKSGIHLVTEAHLDKTYLDGAVCIADDGNPVVALTLRHDRLDNFWFSLMHELAHIALHIDSNTKWFLDDLDAEGGDEQEQEADAMAGEALIPSDKWQAELVFAAGDVQALAGELQVCPEIIAGRLRHERKDQRLFGKLFREKIREHFCH